VKDAGLVKAGEEIRARVARGEIRAVVKKARDTEGRRPTAGPSTPQDHSKSE
jgi:hypothetical protein